MSDTSQDEVVKSDDPRTLEGHRAGSDPSGPFMIDDTWSFKGSD
jgi:hypothetical protein